MYCLRLVLQEVHYLPQCLPRYFGAFIDVYTKFCLDWVLFYMFMYGMRPLIAV